MAMPPCQSCDGPCWVSLATLSCQGKWGLETDWSLHNVNSWSMRESLLAAYRGPVGACDRGSITLARFPFSVPSLCHTRGNHLPGTQGLSLGTRRIGEAQNPGPQILDYPLSSEGEWLFSANVTGAANKAPWLVHDKTTWNLQETHLTSRGQAAFLKKVQQRAKLATPARRWRMSFGQPCQPRTQQSVIGRHQGVAVLTAQPSR